MAKKAKKKATSRPVVKYTLECVGGPIDGKTLTSDTKAAARAQYDALALIAELVVVTKVLERAVTRNELNTTKRTRTDAATTAGESEVG